MNEELFNLLQEADFMPFDIKYLSKEEIIDKEIFDCIFAIEDEFYREKIIMQLEEKARKENCIQNVKNILKQYRKKFNSENKQLLKKEQLKHNEVAEMLLKENSIHIFDNDLYIYINGVYTEDKKCIERKIIQIVPDANSKFRNEVYLNLLLEAESNMIDKESGIINFKNGLFNVKEKKLEEHRAEFFSINQISVNYNENAKKVEAVEKFLDKISTYNRLRKKTILEMIGYCMTTSVKQQKAFILYGEQASNGKSTLCNIIIALIGRKNIANVSFKDMNKHKFASCGVKGKLLNIGAEMTEDYLEDVSNIKMFITGDYLEIEEKHKAKQSISPYAKFIFNANTLPCVADKTNGFYRRLQIIPLETSFTDEEAKKFDINEILAEEALEYLAKISLDAYLAMNDKFSNYEESEREVNKYKMASNSVLGFVGDKENLNSFYDNKLHMGNKVYRCYKDYCEDNQLKSIGLQKFYREIEKSGTVIEKKLNNQKAYIFRNIKKT